MASAATIISIDASSLPYPECYYDLDGYPITEQDEKEIDECLEEVEKIDEEMHREESEEWEEANLVNNE